MNTAASESPTLLEESVLLPIRDAAESQIVSGLADPTQLALQRFAEHRIRQQQASLRQTRRRG